MVTIKLTNKEKIQNKPKPIHHHNYNLHSKYLFIKLFNPLHNFMQIKIIRH